MHRAECRFGYVLRSEADPGTHYVGIASDPHRRLAWHNGGALRRVGPKGEGRFEPIDWNAALDTIATRFHQVMREHGPAALLSFDDLGSMGVVQRRSLRRIFHALGASRRSRRVRALGAHSPLGLQSPFDCPPHVRVHAGGARASRCAVHRHRPATDDHHRSMRHASARSARNGSRARPGHRSRPAESGRRSWAASRRSRRW
jgi:hypothetical protein